MSQPRTQAPSSIAASFCTTSSHHQNHFVLIPASSTAWLYPSRIARALSLHNVFKTSESAIHSIAGHRSWQGFRPRRGQPRGCGIRWGIGLRSFIIRLGFIKWSCWYPVRQSGRFCHAESSWCSAATPPIWSNSKSLDRRTMHITLLIPNKIPRKLEVLTSVFWGVLFRANHLPRSLGYGWLITLEKISFEITYYRSQTKLFFR